MNVRTMKPNLGKTASPLASLLVLAALLAACVQAAVAEEEQTLIISMGKKLGDVTDPTISQNLKPDLGGNQAYHMYTHYSPLISLDREANTIIPWMAESYEVSDDHETVTFHLREGIKFADGTPFNASVAKFNFDRILTYGLVDIYRSKYNGFLYYDKSEAIDEYTFKLYFTKGWASVAQELARSSVYGRFISPEDVSPAWDIEGVLKPEKMYNGLGPYDVDTDESVPGQTVVLTKRHNWRDDYDYHKPKLDKIVITYIADPQTAVLALEKGDIDYICRYWSAPLDTLIELETNSQIAIKTTPGTTMYYMRTAWWKEPFSGTDGILFRKAICYALDRAEIVEAAFNGYAIPATDSMMLSSSRQDVPECCHKGYDYNLDKAKELLEEAGCRDTDGDGILDKGDEPLRDLDLIIVSGVAGLGWMEDMAVMVQSQLKKIGINVQIHSLETGEYVKVRNSGDFDMAFSYNIGKTNPPGKELMGFNKGKNSADKNDYSNQDETLAEIVGNAQSANSKEELDTYLCQACDILYEEAGVTPLVYPIEYAVMAEKVKGFEFGAEIQMYSLDHVEECWIED